MTQRPRFLVLTGSALALTAALLTAPAIAGNDCDVPIADWQPREAVQQMATQKGWQIEHIKIDDGCYKVRALDADGQRIKAKLDPQTLEIIKLKQSKHKKKQKKEHQRQHQPASDAVQDSAPPAAIFTPGSTPRAQVE